MFMESPGEIEVSERPARAAIAKKRPDRPDRRAIELVQSNPAVAANEIRDVDSLVDQLRRRADQLQISRETLDFITGLPSGYSGKVLSRNGTRRLGVRSLELLLDALSLKLLAVSDDEAFARNKSRYVKRDDPHYRSARKGHDGKRGAKSTFEKISGAVTATLGCNVRYVPPPRFESLSGTVPARLGHW